MSVIWKKNIRIGMAFVLVGSLVFYIWEILLGRIPKDHRLGTAELALFVLVTALVFLLINPEILGRLSHFEVSGLKIDLLEKVQVKQGEELANLNLIIPLLLPGAERTHLEHLAKNSDDLYTGSGVLRKELRRLSSISLIERRHGRKITEMADGRNFRLSDYVRLTPLGRDWVARLAEMDAAGK